ncbi:pyruvate dehydrogenase complex dihydrolipoamide acetyltransferase [Wolbachia pipientis]|uniref:Dihydrolipoamide acetyltransferase component of pyruvate dehydrogenase complex n=1 Tax=Wolbachia pipientis TaxID=955 RepID=A0A1E7QJ79_WOLPI|nr:dihydrolipoamide acetyltransferase family protein [Wolbachia pipientis]OEY86523.1 pyruvate dehydrogenase complex dihydrolipoamide acetyltransferase [Wolbachia pipientis]
MPIKILMPALSPTMNKTGGKIVKWHKQESDKVEVGDVIAEIETDKAIMEFESVDEGVMAKILVPAGTSGVPVNQLIALMIEEGEEYLDTIEDIIAEVEIKETVKQESRSDERKIDKRQEERIKITPIASKIASDHGVDIKQLRGSGPYGRIIKIDVLDAVSVNDINYGEVTEVSSMRQVIAQRLVESKQTIPHFYLTVDCQVDKLITLKNAINTHDKDNKVTINDLVIKAAAIGIRKFPAINASWIDNKILKYHSIDISVAVALDDGLVTPIVKDVDNKNILSISLEVKNLVNRARSGKLRPEEFQGGGFTVSNLGMFGIKTFSAIINPPQSCIIAIGTSEKRPIVVDEKVEIAEIMTVTLSVDHRTVDGVLGAKFLNAFKYYVENPLLILI